MATTVTPHRFTVRTFQQLDDVGLLDQDERFELLDEAIVHLTPPPYLGAVNRRAQCGATALAGHAPGAIQHSVDLGLRPAVQPESAPLAWRDDSGSAMPTSEDVLLLSEIADTSPRHACVRTGRIDARAAILDAWVADLNNGQRVVHREPTPPGYRAVHIYRRGETVTPLAFPVEAIVGPAEEAR